MSEDPSKPYKRIIQYQFCACGELINITDLDPDYDYVWVEEARKNGQEDCHMAGELLRSHDGTFVWVEGEEMFVEYGSQELADAIVRAMRRAGEICVACDCRSGVSRWHLHAICDTPEACEEANNLIAIGRWRVSRCGKCGEKVEECGCKGPPKPE